MNRNFLLIAILLLSAGIAWYVWNNRKDPTSNLDRAESNFKIEDVNTIGRIIITNKEGMRSDLKRNDDRWLINDQHLVRKTNIEHLLNGIHRQHLDYIPNKAAVPDIIKSMAVNGIHVEIFDRSGKELLNYYVGGVTQDERGTFFLKEGSSQPYTLIEPGFEGGLRARYSLRPGDWRDIRFWIEDTKEIDTLKVHYPKQRQHSFILYKSGNEYKVDPMFNTTPRKAGNPTVRAASYITTLEGLACENFLPDSPAKDSILNLLPFMEMEMIYDTASNYLKFIPVAVLHRVEGSATIPRFYIDYSGNDFMIAQHEVIKGAFRSYDFFFE